MRIPNKHIWFGEKAIFVGDYCTICRRTILTGTGKSNHALAHQREGVAVRIGDGTKNNPFQYILR